MPSVILTDIKHRISSKEYYRDKDGDIRRRDYNAGKYFNIESIELYGIQALSIILTRLEHRSSSFIIRGAPYSDDVELSKPVRRKIHREGDNPNESPFIDTPQDWMMIDIDKLKLDPGIDFLRSPEDAVKFAINHLPREFQNTQCHWQFSSSAGFGDPTILKVHLWFWLTQPVTCYELRQWAKKINLTAGYKLIDSALYNPVQPHYTANPVFLDGIKDPVQQRSGFLDERNDLVEINLEVLREQNVERTQILNALDATFSSEAKGYHNILSNMGDHPGGDGFYYPILRATASIVREKGKYWVHHNIEQIILEIKESIDLSDQSNHPREYIASKSTGDYLRGQLLSAIDKGYGDHAELTQPYYNTDPLTIEEAQARLTDAIYRFQGRIHLSHLRESSDPEAELHRMKSLDIGIKATAGLGKTSEIIRLLISRRVAKPVHVEYYVPTHALSAQVAESLRRELTEKSEFITGILRRLYPDQEIDPPPVIVNVIKGRDKQTNDGHPMCHKSEEAKRLTQLGYSVQSFLCANPEGNCEFFFECPYQQQFMNQDADRQARELNLPVVNVMAHEYMFLNKRDELPRPEFIVVDESFLRSAVRRIEVEPTDLRRSKSDLCRLIFDALYDKRSLLKILRENGITPSVLRDAAYQLMPMHDVSNLNPKMSWDQQKKIISEAEKPNNINILLNTLAEELEITDRDDSYTVELIQNRTTRVDTIAVHTRKDLNIAHDIPVLFIDADLNPKLINIFRPDTEIIEIPVERQATVHQFDKTFSLTSMNKGKLLGQTQTFIRMVAQKGSTLVITTKSIRGMITGGDSEGGNAVIGEFSGAKIVHYSNLRGLNDFKDYQNVIIIGREQPAPTDLEAQAKALWWDCDEVIKTVPEKSNSSPYADEPRGYRMEDGSQESTRIRVHPDRRVQDLLELAREAELCRV